MYVSKNDIYRDYDIAIKLCINPKVGALGKGVYSKLYERLKIEQHAKIQELEWSVENFNSIGSRSMCTIIEIPKETSSGKLIGTHYALLEHETGLEIFLKVAEHLSQDLLQTAVAVAVLDKVYEKIGEKALDKFLSFLTRQWDKVTTYKIDFVEIRTEHKGVMRIAFEDFNVKYLKCLLLNFDNINLISDVNETCFEGKLIDPPSTTPLSDDY